MDITSGGTPGPRLADEWAALDNNVYGLLRGGPPVARLAEAFVAAGEVGFSGVVDPARLEDLAAAFTSLGLAYSIELWNGDRTDLIRQLDGPAPA